MRRIWKNFQTNMMYWRFRHVTRNRLRVRSWWQRHRPAGNRAPRNVRYSPPTGRGMAAQVYRRSTQRTWIILIVMVLLLTALTTAVDQVIIQPYIVFLIGALVVSGSIYWALRNV